MDIVEFVDTGKYPVTDSDSQSYHKLISNTQQQIAKDGCAILKGFIKPEKIDVLQEEAHAVSHLGHRSFNRTNVHFCKDDPTLDASHPIRRFYDRSNAFVPADNFPAHSVLRQIYEWPAFRHFVQSSLKEKRFYPYADPLADVIVNVTEQGHGFPWHFDTNNFTVTLAIQNGEQGGVFEYAPWLRSAEDENFPGVQAILDGDSSKVKSINLQPGDLQIFKGRYSLHRVTPVVGNSERYVAIFSFVEQPGMVGSVERTKQLYGRVLPIHYEMAGKRNDSLQD